MIELLRSQVATLVVLVLALIAQLPHAAEVFMQAGHVQGVWGTVHGYAYAVALELAVLIFVVQGRKLASYAFAAVSILVNLSYYAERETLWSWSAFDAWLISFALSIALALYSHALAEEDARSDALRDAWVWLQMQLARLRKVDDAPQLDVHDTPSHDDDDEWVTRAVRLRELGRTYAEIAEQVGKHQSTVSRRLNGAIA